MSVERVWRILLVIWSWTGVGCVKEFEFYFVIDSTKGVTWDKHFRGAKLWNIIEFIEWNGMKWNEKKRKCKWNQRFVYRFPKFYFINLSFLLSFIFTRKIYLFLLIKVSLRILTLLLTTPTNLVSTFFTPEVDLNCFY